MEDILYELSKIRNADSDNVHRGLWLMYFADSVLGNTDRHKGNWGLCRGYDGVYRFSPIFDNGASLFPRNKNYEIDAEWMQERAFVFPNSKIMFNGVRERLSYYNIWRTDVIPSWLREFAESLDVKQVIKNTFDCLQLSDVLYSYYATVIYYRFNAIIKDNYTWEGML